jgi:hypothetical protein
MIDLDTLSPDLLPLIGEAAHEVSQCMRVLTKTGDSLVGEVLRGSDQFYEWRHYPLDDVYDPEFHAQYYYHAHPANVRESREHGHFHTFLRPLGMPEGIHPLPLPDLKPDPDGNSALSHLIGIAMDPTGMPIRLFTTNRWVTGETWYAADDVIRMLDQFIVDHARPSWPLNRWITAMIQMYRPHIEELLRQRDVTVTARQQQAPSVNVFEDRSLEVTSALVIDLRSDILAVEGAVRRMRRRIRQSQIDD